MLWVPTHMVAWGVRLRRVEQSGEKELPPFFFNKQEYLDLFEYLTNPWVCAVPPSHTYRVITRRNPMAMAPRCWQEVSNQESHRYILGGLRNYYVNPLKL